MPAEHYDMEAEKEILGAIQLDDTALSMVEPLLRAEDFFNPAHSLIFTAAQALSQRGESIHVITLASELKRRKQLAGIGGASYLTTLTDSAPTSAHIETHAKTVARHATVRRLLAACRVIIAKADEPSLDPEDLSSFADKRFADAVEGRAVNDVVPFCKVVDEVMDRVISFTETGTGTTGLATGLTDFDRLTAGLHPGQLIVIAARPAMGKTSLMMNIVEHVASTNQKPVLVFSLEMPRQELGTRMIACRAKVDQSKLRTLKFTQQDFNAFVQASQTAYQLPILIHDDGNVTLTELRALCRRTQVRYGLSMVCVDYLQLMRPGGKYESREREISEMSRAFKALAKELGVPVMALSQLNRECEKRTDKRPMLSDLRESGAIEQDADVVAFVYREEVYDKDNNDVKGLAELIVAKQRNGPCDTVRLAWNKELTRFSNLASQDHHDQEWHVANAAGGDAE